MNEFEEISFLWGIFRGVYILKGFYIS